MKQLGGRVIGGKSQALDMTCEHLSIWMWALSPAMDECEREAVVPKLARSEAKFRRNLPVIDD